MRKAYDLIVNSPLLATFILIIPTLVYFFLRHFGEAWGLMSSDGKLTAEKSFIVWTLLAIWILFILLKSYADKHNNLVKHNGQLVLKHLWSNTNAIVQFKLSRIVHKIESNDIDINSYTDLLEPELQISRIISNLQVSTAAIFELERDQICISIICSMDGGKSWDWRAHVGLETSETAESLVANSKSTLHQVALKGKRSILHTDKRKAIQKGKYHASSKDEKYNNVGSIYCEDISVGTNQSLVKSIISISTYGVKFFNNYDVGSRDKFKNYLMPNFVYRLKLELATLYVSQKIS